MGDVSYLGTSSGPEQSPWKHSAASTQKHSNARNGLPKTLPQRRTEGEAPKTVAGVAGPVGVPAVCRASNHPFGECAQLETVGHNPRTAFTRSNRLDRPRSFPDGDLWAAIQAIGCTLRELAGSRKRHRNACPEGVRTLTVRTLTFDAGGRRGVYYPHPGTQNGNPG